MQTENKAVTWKSNGRIHGRENQVELIRSDKYNYQGVSSVIIKSHDCDEIATAVLAALNQMEDK